MNHAFRRSARQTFLVAMTMSLVVNCHLPLWANPNGGTIVAGSASINQSGNTLTVNQQSNRAVVNWQGFSIGAGEVTQFNQPGANAAILNRVTGGDPSAILGQLQANGQIFLINPNGILIGQGAQLNVGGFTASTLDVDNSQFMRGGDLDFRGNSQASVVNRGTINASSGDIFLVGADVQNHGTLNAPNGTVGLAAGSHVRLADGERPHLVVKTGATSISSGVTNTGTIDALRAELAANGNNVYGLAINNSGTIRATGATVKGGEVYLTAPGGTITNTGDLIAHGGAGRVLISAPGGTINQTGNIIASQGNDGGQVTLDTRSVIGQPRTGTTNVSGTIQATGANGGSVHLMGDIVGISAAQIDASGTDRGGEVLIGGDYQGQERVGDDSTLHRNALNTTVDDATTINAASSNGGDGGKIIVWADGRAEYRGHADVSGGNGGFVEVSGRDSLVYDGTVNLAGQTGTNGTLLLDPQNIEIQFLLAPPLAGFTRISPLAIILALGTGNVVVHTSDANSMMPGDVLVNQPIIYNSANSFSIFAHRHIRVNGSILNFGAGDLNLVAGWDGATGFTPVTPALQPMSMVDIPMVFGNQASFGNNGGSVFIGDGMQVIGIASGSRFGATNVAANDLNLTGSAMSPAGFSQLGFRFIGLNFNINAPIDIALKGDLNATAGGSSDTYAQVGHGGQDFVQQAAEPDGAFRGAITVRQANNLNFRGGNGENAYAQLGHGGNETDGNHRGDITINANDINFLGGTANDTYAQLGHGGDNADGNHSADINIRSTGNLVLAAGTGDDAYSQIGLGGNNADGNMTGLINILANNATLTGNMSNDTFAQIGHGGDGADGVMNGNLLLRLLGDLQLNGGTGTDTHAQVGHGSVSGGTGGDRIGDISIVAGGSAILDSPGIDGFALLGHATSSGQIMGNLVLAVDQTDPLTDGGGRLALLTETTGIDMGGSPNQVRIFDTRRDGPNPQFIANGARINDIPFDNVNFAPATLSIDGWNQNTEFQSWDHEQWGDGNSFTLANPGPYTGPFTFFFLGEKMDPVPPVDPPMMMAPQFMPPPFEVYWQWTAHEFLARTLFNGSTYAPNESTGNAKITSEQAERPEGELAGASAP